MVPRKEMENDLKGQEKELNDDINSLNKKVHCILVRYLSANTIHSQNIWKNNSMMRRLSCATLYVYRPVNYHLY